MNQQNKQKDVVKQWNEFCKMEEENSKEKEKMVTKKRKMMEEITIGMCEKDEEIGKLRKENRALKLKMAKMEADLKAQNVSIRRVMPAELFNELFASMALENAFERLAKMPNGLLARTVQKMIEGIKEAMKNNKFNSADSGSRLVISDERNEAKHCGPNAGVNSVRAVLPIPSYNLKVINKPIIASYFEMEILNGFGGIVIGICNQYFSLEGNWLGLGNNSIGIGCRFGLWIDGSPIKYGFAEESSKKVDFIGLGIIHQPSYGKMEFFATLNGKLLKKSNLPLKFASLQFFPAINLFDAGNSIRVNFGKDEWQFKEFKCVFE